MANVQHASLTGADLHTPIRYYQAGEPASGMADGDLWWDTDDDTLHRYNGSAWEALGGGLGLADPGADRIVFWDESENDYAFLTVGSGLSISTTTLTATAGATTFAMPHWKSGQYYDAGTSGQAGTTTAALTANQLYASPLFVPLTSAGGNPSVDRIGINVTAGGGSGFSARLGIYTMGSDGLPGTLVVESPSALSLTSNASFQSTISQALTGGTWYWTAIVSDGTPTITSYNSYQLARLGWANLGDTTFTARPQVGHAFGALPSPFGTPSSLGSNGVTFRVAVRAV